MGHIGTRPYEGFSPKIPQKPLGMRIDPAPSDPWWSGPSPAAAAAPAPALEPPVVMFVFQGLGGMPGSGLSPWPVQPNSCVVGLAAMAPPALLLSPASGGSPAR